MKLDNKLIIVMHNRNAVRKTIGFVEEKLEQIVKKVEQDMIFDGCKKVNRYHEFFPHLSFADTPDVIFRQIGNGARAKYEIEMKIKCSSYWFRRKFKFHSTRQPSLKSVIKSSQFFTGEELDRLKTSDFHDILNRLDMVLENWD